MTWPRKALADVAVIGPPQPNTPVGDRSEVTFLPMSAVDELKNRHSDGEVRTWAEVRSGFSRFQDGDVLFSKITPCMENGKITVARRLKNGVGAGSTEFMVIRPGPGLHADFLAHYLLQEDIRKAAKSVMAGAVGQQRVPRSFVEQLKIPTPPITAQQRIVATLEMHISRLEAAEAATLRISENIKRARTSVLKAGVEGLLVPTEADLARKHGRSYEHASVLLERIREERRSQWANDGARGTCKEVAPPNAVGLSPLPEGWVWVTLGQLTTVITSGSRNWAKHYADQGPLFVRAQDIKTDKLLINDLAHVKPPQGTEGSRTALRVGDLLLTITGANVTKAAIVQDDLGEAYVSQHVGLCRPVSKALASFLHFWIIAPSGGRSWLLKAAYGAGKPGLNLDHLRNLPVPLPPLVEQARIAAELERRLSVLEKCEETVAKVRQRSGSLRQAVLKAAFSGTLVHESSRQRNEEAAL